MNKEKQNRPNAQETISLHKSKIFPIPRRVVRSAFHKLTPKFLENKKRMKMLDINPVFNNPLSLTNNTTLEKARLLGRFLMHKVIRSRTKGKLPVISEDEILAFYNWLEYKAKDEKKTTTQFLLDLYLDFRNKESVLAERIEQFIEDYRLTEQEKDIFRGVSEFYWLFRLKSENSLATK